MNAEPEPGATFERTSAAEADKLAGADNGETLAFAQLRRQRQIEVDALVARQVHAVVPAEPAAN